MVNDRPELFLPLKIFPEAGDEVLLSPVYLLPVNIMERGLLTRVKLTTKTVLVDASSGRASSCDGRVKLCAARELPAAARELPVKLSPAEAEAVAETAASPEEARGWRRGLRSAELFFLDSGRALAWRAYIVRGSLLIDTFTGESRDTSSVIDIFF